MGTILALASIVRSIQTELLGRHHDFRFVDGATCVISQAREKIAEGIDLQDEMPGAASFEYEVHTDGRAFEELRRVNAVLKRVKPGARGDGRTTILPLATAAAQMQVRHRQSAQAKDGKRGYATNHHHTQVEVLA